MNFRSVSKAPFCKCLTLKPWPTSYEDLPKHCFVFLQQNQYKWDSVNFSDIDGLSEISPSLPNLSALSLCTTGAEQWLLQSFFFASFSTLNAIFIHHLVNINSHRKLTGFLCNFCLYFYNKFIYCCVLFGPPYCKGVWITVYYTCYFI